MPDGIMDSGYDGFVFSLKWRVKQMVSTYALDEHSYMLGFQKIHDEKTPVLILASKSFPIEYCSN